MTQNSDFIYSSVLPTGRVAHLFTTRSGGVSEGVFASMNLAAGSGSMRDSADNIRKNHQICAAALGYTVHDVCRTNQQHTAVVEVVDERHRGTGLDKPPFDHGVDGIVTATPGVVLTARGADCPVLLAADEKNGVIGALHSGWRGTLANAASVLLDAMCAIGGDRRHICAAVSPSIRGCCYEVGSELYRDFSAAGYSFAFSPSTRTEGRYMLDLAEVLRFQLQDGGVDPPRIDVLDGCTCCCDSFFSHRRMGVERGTGGGFIVLTK